MATEIVSSCFGIASSWTCDDGGGGDDGDGDVEQMVVVEQRFSTPGEIQLFHLSQHNIPTIHNPDITTTLSSLGLKTSHGLSMSVHHGEIDV